MKIGWHLLVKDLHEHWHSLAAMFTAVMVIVLLSIEKFQHADFGISSLSVVRFSLLSAVPLVVFIVAQRLVVREYVGGTQRFLEALPIPMPLALLHKYFFGLVYLLCLAALIVFVVVKTASAAEDITFSYARLVMLKTATVVLLYWSLAFALSFCGRLRLFIYVLIATVLMLIIAMPQINEARFSPIALLKAQQFVLEREFIPWFHLIVCWCLSALLLVVAFVMALINDGSLVERLSKPISRRDIAALSLLCFASLSVFSTLHDKWDREEYQFRGDAVLRHDYPAVSVMYISDENKEKSEHVLQRQAAMLARFQADMGLTDLPHVRLLLDPDLEKYAFDVQLLDGVLATANYLNYDEFDDAVLGYLTLHHMMLGLTQSRMDYETRHWLLDGLARWWAEGGIEAKHSVNNAEMLALSAYYAKRLAAQQAVTEPLIQWQGTADQLGFFAADSLAYSAILFMEEQLGIDVLLRLIRSYLTESVGSSSFETVSRLMNNDEKRFKTMTGVSISDFTQRWLQWLQLKSQEESIADFLKTLPSFTTKVESLIDEEGSYGIDIQLHSVESANSVHPIEGNIAQCSLRHINAGPFDQETMMSNEDPIMIDCTKTGVVHRIRGEYASGERVFLSIDYNASPFHYPVNLWSGRVQMP